MTLYTQKCWQVKKLASAVIRSVKSTDSHLVGYSRVKRFISPNDGQPLSITLAFA